MVENETERTTPIDLAMDLRAKSPPGWEKWTEEHKDHEGIDNPFALAWYLHDKGATPGDVKGVAKPGMCAGCSAAVAQFKASGKASDYHQRYALDARDFSQEKRDKLAEKGHAMKDGSYPIVSVGDLKNAIQSIGRAKDYDATKRHIIKRARALKALDQLPSDWDASEKDVNAGSLSIVAAKMVVAGGDEYGDFADHPNRHPFKGILHQVDVPSTRPPSGSGGKRVMIPHQAAQRRLKSLLGMSIDVSSNLKGHNARFKVGVITACAIGRDPAPDVPLRVGPIRPNDVVIAGHLYAKDFPEEVRALKASAARGELGASYEISQVDVEDVRASVWHVLDFVYTGAAVLRRDAAAYDDSAIAAAAEGRGEEMTREEVKALADEICAKLEPRFARLEAGATRSREDEEQARSLDLEADTKLDQAQALRRECRSLRARIEAAEGDPEEEAKETKEEEMKEMEKKEAEARACEAAAADLRMKALVLRAAPQFRPILEAVGELITDGFGKAAGLITDSVVAKTKNLLATDTGAPQRQQQGGPTGTPPQRRSQITAARVLDKYNTDLHATSPGNGVKPMTEAQASELLRDLPPEQRLRRKLELQAQGLLVG
jgi:hypothetical protein